MDKLVLAVVGLPGAGKSEVAEYIVKKTAWPKIHFGRLVTDEVTRRGMELTQENEKVVRDEYRAKLGIGALAIMAMPEAKEHIATAGKVILESFYSWEEYLEMKKEFGDAFRVLAVFASPEVRAARLASRPLRPLTPDGVRERDYSQIETLHQGGPIARADWTVINEGTAEELHQKIDAILEKLI
jgi:dephospho-CoA kinase